MTTAQAVLTVGVVALGTLLTRVLPFLLFPDGRRTPPVIDYLGRVLPCAVIGMLVIYCLRETDPSTVSGFAPELIALAAVCALHLWRRSTLLSIAGGTALYMLLVQTLFLR